MTTQTIHPEPKPLTVEDLGDALGIGHDEIGRTTIIALLGARKLDDLILAEPLIERGEILFHESAIAYTELIGELKEHMAAGALATDARIIIEAFMPRLPEMWHRVRAGERLIADVKITYMDETTKTVSLQFLQRALTRITVAA